MIILPSLPIVPEHLNPHTLLIYGGPKIGKTTMIPKLPGKYLLHDVDIGGSGSDFVTAVKIKSPTLGHFEETLNVIKLQKEPPYDFYALDGLDTIEAWAERSATQKFKKSVLGKNFEGESVLELPKGGGFHYFWNEFFRIIKMTHKIAKYVIFIGPLANKIITRNGDQIQNDPRLVEKLGIKGATEVNQGVEVMSKNLDLTGKLSVMIMRAVDATGYVYRNKKGELRISFNTAEELDCGTRVPHLVGQDIVFDDWRKIYVNT